MPFSRSLCFLALSLSPSLSPSLCLPSSHDRIAGCDVTRSSWTTTRPRHHAVLHRDVQPKGHVGCTKCCTQGKLRTTDVNCSSLCACVMWSRLYSQMLCTHVGHAAQQGRSKRLASLVAGNLRALLPAGNFDCIHQAAAVRIALKFSRTRT